MPGLSVDFTPGATFREERISRSQKRRRELLREATTHDGRASYGEAVQVIHCRKRFTGEHVRHGPAGWKLVGPYGARHVLVGEVENSELIPAFGGQLVDENEHSAMRYLGDVDLATGGDAVVRAHPQDGLQLAQEARVVGQLVWNGAVKTPAPWHARRRFRCRWVDAHEVMGGTVYPTGIAAAQEFRYLCGRERQHPAHIPPRQREDTRLQGVEHRQQKVCPPDLVDVVDVVQVSDAECCGDDGRGSARDAVGGENQVVRRVLAGQLLEQIAADRLAEGLAGDLIPFVRVDVVAVTGRTSARVRR